MINESSVASVKHTARVMLATVIAFILMVCVFAVNAFAGEAGQYNVVINDNGYEYTIATKETEPIEILNEASIKLGSNDKLNIASFNSGIGGTIYISRLNRIYIKFNNKVKSYDVYAKTVGVALDESGVYREGLVVNYDDDTPIQDGMVITVDSPKIVTINADGKTYNLGTANSSVADLIAEAGITLGDNDYTEPSLNTFSEDGMEINVYRVEIKTVTKNEKIAHKTKTINDSTLDKGKTKIETKGVDGERSATYRITYINGVESEKREVTSTVLKEPVTAVKRVGTKTVVIQNNGVEKYNGISVGSVLSGSYTHYCACEICCGKSNGVTASGKKLTNGMENPYYVACNWLPLGSMIEVNGVTYTVGDRGGSDLSRTGRIDIYTPEGHTAAKQSGRGSASIKILRLGW
ncbi:MAG: G5 domain-containing protein [Eubacterium sp.]|nr:G5 domain-containing protein [Eubacterium sp.]